MVNLMSIDNTLWDSIKYVSSGISLIAFVVATIAWTYRNKINERERILRSLPEKDRSSALPEVLAWLKIDPKDLTKSQQFDLALTQIRERTKQYLISTIAVAFVFMIGAAVTIYAISQSGRLPQQSDPLKYKDAQPSASDKVTNNSPAAATLGNNSEVASENCGAGKSIRLYRYYGADKSGHDETFEQLQGILVNRILALAEQYAGLGGDYKDISTLHICVIQSHINSAKHVADIFTSDRSSIELSTGTIFYDSTTPIARSNIYISHPEGPKLLDVENFISAAEFGNLRDEFTIITLVALAVDAKRNNLPISVIVKYLGEAQLLVSKSSSERLKALINSELEPYRVALIQLSG